MKKEANRHSWRIKPIPTKKEELLIEADIEAEAFERIRQGFVPQTPSDKWFIYMGDDGWLYCHRAASGSCIFGARFHQQSDGTGYTISKAWVSRDGQAYRSTDTAYDARLFIYLLRCLLLGHDVPFPTPTSMPHSNKNLHERHVMGENGQKPASFISLDDLLN